MLNRPANSTAPVMRTCAGPGADCLANVEKEKTIVQRHAVNQSQVSNGLPLVDEVLRSPGEPFDAETRSFFESRFGHDFSRVRIHTDGPAAASARAVNALAYTVGNDVVFAGGQYAPRAESGRRLIAHELAHTIQQGGAAIQTGAPYLQRQEPGPALDDFPPLTRPADPGECLTKISANDMEAKAQEPNTISVIELGADWCGPCKLLKKVLNEVCADYKTMQNPAYRFYEVNIEESPEIKAMLSEKYGAAVPVTLFFGGGKQLTVMEGGAHPKADIAAILAQVTEATKPTKREQRQIDKGAVQPKLALSTPGDAYEQEADRVADIVMRSPETLSRMATFSNSSGPLIQRKCGWKKDGEDGKGLFSRHRNDAQPVPDAAPMPGAECQPASPETIGCVTGRSLSSCRDGVYDLRYNNNYCCTRECTDQHEAVHKKIQDASGCCKAYGLALSQPGADKDAIDKKYFAWLDSAEATTECQAYTAGAACADQLAVTNNCAGEGSSSECCRNIEAYKKAEADAASCYCAAASAEVPPCPEF